MERVNFIFSSRDQHIEAELPDWVLSNFFFSQTFILPQEMIVSQSNYFAKKADITLKVTGNPVNNETSWEVPVEQQMLSGNRG